MATQYKASDLYAAVWDSKIDQNAPSQIDQLSVANFAMREVIRDLDLRSMKRLAAAIDVFDDIYDFACPSDIKGIKIIDLVPQVNRSSNFEINLTTPEEFDRRKSFDKTLVAFNDHDGLRKLRLAVIVNSNKQTISPLDSTTSGGGTWSATGDATNIRADSQNYVEGAGSLLWDIGAGGTGTAGIVNTSLNTFDITNYLLQGSVFLWVYVQTTTHLSSFTLRLGSSSSNYYSFTVTQTNEGNSFSSGWNLLRFDFSSASTVGSPTATSTKYAYIVATSSPAITSSPNWRFDGLIIANGQWNQVLYYSKYGWQDSSTSAWKENATVSGDYLNVDTEEFNLVVLRAKMESDRRLRDWNAHTIDKEMYEEAKAAYLDMYPSDARPLVQTHYDLASSLNLQTDTNTIVEVQENADNQIF
jgi:hypothetical protein